MDNAQIRFVFDAKKIASETKKGLLQIEVRLTGSNRRKTISTGIHLYKNQFSDKNGFTCKNHPNATAITGQAASIFRKIEAFVLSDKCKSIEDTLNWNKSPEQTYSVIKFIFETLRKDNQQKETYKHHLAFIRKLEKFGKIKVFSDITYQNVIDFDFFLKQNGVVAGASLNKKHTLFKYYIKKAINLELLSKNPYDNFKMPSPKGKKPVFLVQNEIEMILNYFPKIEKIQHTKDLFVFQIFTGMAYVDLMSFSKNDVSEMNGMKIIRSNRHKTDESFISLFLPEAEEIAEKYNYELPKLSNQKYNDYLKVLGAGAEIKKNLTSHVARHTFATYLLNKNIPIESVSRALGHSTIKMTEHYAKMLGQKVVNDMKKLL